MNTTEKGREGEKYALRFYKESGFRIIATNYRALNAEIDIIAEKGSTLVFCEVKLRADAHYGGAESAVPYAKQRKVSRAAAAFLTRFGGFDREIRFDVIAIESNNDKTVIKHIPGAFDYIGD